MARLSVEDRQIIARYPLLGGLDAVRLWLTQTCILPLNPAAVEVQDAVRALMGALISQKAACYLMAKTGSGNLAEVLTNLLPETRGQTFNFTKFRYLAHVVIAQRPDPDIWVAVFHVEAETALASRHRPTAALGRPQSELLFGVRHLRPHHDLLDRGNGRPQNDLLDRGNSRPHTALPDRGNSRPHKNLPDRGNGRAHTAFPEGANGRPLNDLPDVTPDLPDNEVLPDVPNELHQAAADPLARPTPPLAYHVELPGVPTGPLSTAWDMDILSAPLKDRRRAYHAHLHSVMISLVCRTTYTYITIGPERENELYHFGRWKGDPHDVKTQTQWNWFMNFQAEVLAYCDKRLYAAKHGEGIEIAQEAGRQPVVLLGPRNESELGIEYELDWHNAHAVGIVDPSAESMVWLAQQRDRAVRHVFAAQPGREFIYAFCLDRQRMDVWVHNRFTSIHVDAYFSDTEPARLVEMLVAFSMMDDEQLGTGSRIADEDVDEDEEDEEEESGNTRKRQRHTTETESRQTPQAGPSLLRSPHHTPQPGPSALRSPHQTPQPGPSTFYSPHQTPQPGPSTRRSPLQIRQAGSVPPRPSVSASVSSSRNGDNENEESARSRWELLDFNRQASVHDTT